MTSKVTCGQILWLGAHGVVVPRGGIDLEALKIVKVAEIIDSTIRLQLKFTPRRAIFAIRTLVLTTYVIRGLVADLRSEKVDNAYQVLGVLFLGLLLVLFKNLLLVKSRA